MGVTLAGVGSATFTGRNGAGSISVPGLVAGDKVVVSSYDPNLGVGYEPPGTLFESTISVDDEIQQLTGNFSTSTCSILFFRGV